MKRIDLEVYADISLLRFKILPSTTASLKVNVASFNDHMPYRADVVEGYIYITKPFGYDDHIGDLLAHMSTLVQMLYDIDDDGLIELNTRLIS